MSEKTLGLADVDDAQHIAIKKAICPGCQYELPDGSEEQRKGPVFVHRLPRTEFSMPCWADSYRRARVACREGAGVNS